MATSRLNRLILDAARLLQQPRTAADSSGDTSKQTIKSADWVNYANRAIRDIILDNWKELGIKFGERFPELMKTSGALALVTGSVAKPTDAFRIPTLYTSTLKLERIPDELIVDVLTGRSLITPSTTRPVFYEEGSNIKVLPITFAVNVTARYVISFEDISVVTGANGNGKLSTAPGTWVLATRTLTIAMNAAFSANDKNRRIFFTTNTNTVHQGLIESVTGAGIVVLSGDGFPADSVISDARMEQTSGTDIPLDKEHDSEILARMVQAAREDGSRSANA